MQTNRKRYKGHEDEIKEDVRINGLLPAQRHWGAKDSISWGNYVQELMGDEAYRYVTEASCSSLDEICEKIAAKLMHQIMSVSRENDELREKLSAYENAEALKYERNRQIAAQLLYSLE